MTERLTHAHTHTHTHTHTQFKHHENTRILDLLKMTLVRKTKQNFIQTKQNENLEEFQNKNNIINITSSQLVVIFLTQNSDCLLLVEIRDASQHPIMHRTAFPFSVHTHTHAHTECKISTLSIFGNPGIELHDFIDNTGKTDSQQLLRKTIKTD